MTGAIGMRTRFLGAAVPGRAVAAVAAVGLLTLLGGCAATPGPSAPAPSPDSAVVAGVGDEVVLLNCSRVVPVDAVAGVLGLTPAEVVELPTSLGTTPPYSAQVPVAMATTAMNRAGQQQCRYGQAGRGDAGPMVSVSMLPDAAGEFARVQPDSNDGVAELAPSALGDTAYSGCQSGQWPGCRAEVLTGQTWLSIAVARPDLRPADFGAYAGTVVAAVAPLKLARPSAPPRPECGALLSPHDLSVTGGLAGAARVAGGAGADGLTLAESGSLATAAEVRGGLVQCAWSGAAETGGVSLTVLPGAGTGWSAMSPAVTFATDTLPAIDLTAQAGARWPTSGLHARGACTPDGCEVTLMADGVWLTVATTGGSGATGLDAAAALAAAAYVRYTAAL